MGCAFSRKRFQCLSKKSKIPRRCDSSVRFEDLPSVAPVPHKSNAVPPAMKCSKAFEGLGQFSTLAFMAGDKDADYMPNCMTYEGYHEYGFNIITIFSDEYSRAVNSMRADCIPGAIYTLTAEERFILIFQNKNGGTTFLPDTTICVRNLFHSLCTRFGDQLLNIIVRNPSWYVLWCLEYQALTGRHFFSETSMTKLKFTNDVGEFARLTGFPGEIKTQ